METQRDLQGNPSVISGAKCKNGRVTDEDKFDTWRTKWSYSLKNNVMYDLQGTLLKFQENCDKEKIDMKGLIGTILGRLGGDPQGKA